MNNLVKNIDEFKENMVSLNSKLRIDRITHLLEKNQNADLKKQRTACVNRYIINKLRRPGNELHNIGEYIEEEKLNNERTNLLKDSENYQEFYYMEYSQSGDGEGDDQIIRENLLDKFNSAACSQNKDSEEETRQQHIIEISDNEN